MKRFLIYLVLFILLVIIVAIFQQKPRKAVRVKPAPVVLKGKIAIVLDDWGYNLNNLKTVEGIKYPLNLSVLPNLKYSKEIAARLHAKGFEIMLHLPMEPMEKIPLEKNTVLISMTKDTVKIILDNDLTGLPYVKGINNHMGSKATGNLKTMEALFRELKKRGLYFLDSFVTPDSVCSELSRRLNYKIFKRDIFLDNIPERKYILGQIDRLKAKAAKTGFAIGIGHDRKATLEVLTEVMPIISREGYKFVFLSEMNQ